jgi:hypothetical protein
VFGNVGTIIALGATDAEVLAPRVRATDLIALPYQWMYVRLMIDGKPTEQFSAETMPPDEGWGCWGCPLDTLNSAELPFTDLVCCRLLRQP